MTLKAPAADAYHYSHPEELDAMDEDEEPPMPQLPMRSGNAAGGTANGTS